MFAIIFLAAPEVTRAIFFDVNHDCVEIARKGLAEGRYIATAPIYCELEGAEAAEEMFDLTNNPSRQAEREEKYGRGRSVSIGDIVCINGEMCVCLSMGWAKL